MGVVECSQPYELEDEKTVMGKRGARRGSSTMCGPKEDGREGCKELVRCKLRCQLRFWVSDARTHLDVN